MGRLAQINGASIRHVEADGTIGRSPHCALRLEREEVSSQHASLRWNGGAWELRDLGSRNGTWLDGKRVEVGRSYPLAASATLAFGHPDEQWTLVSDAPPRVMVVNLVTGQQLLAQDRVVGIPSEETPSATVYANSSGVWCLETEDGRTVALQSGTRFEVADQPWRFCCPEVVASTVSTGAASRTEELTLRFLVSRDEEYVELRVEWSDRVLHLGSRSHNHLLLTLARARLKDLAAGEPVTSCGWVYKDDLVSAFESPQRIDNEVFRVRQHFARLVPDAGAEIVERRARTRQLRVGIHRLLITTL
ncbi:MAG: FHA domain-containing protein [Deltaproteobacteria bacterium]